MRVPDGPATLEACGAPRRGSEVRHIAGDPFDPVMAGPSSACWGAGPGDEGTVMYVTTDGGTVPATIAGGRAV